MLRRLDQTDVPNVPPQLTEVGLASARFAWTELSPGDATAATSVEGEMEKVLNTRFSPRNLAVLQFVRSTIER